SFGSFVSQVAEVSSDRGRIRVHRVTCAIDCGIAVNPLMIAAQMESGLAYGLSAALYSALHRQEGRVQETNFHDHRVLRPAAVAACGPRPSPQQRADAVAAFGTVQEVFQHPRCRNCHIPGDAPLQYDAGTPHAMAVARGPDGHGSRGLPCTTCHGTANLPV